MECFQSLIPSQRDLMFHQWYQISWSSLCSAASSDFIDESDSFCLRRCWRSLSARLCWISTIGSARAGCSSWPAGWWSACLTSSETVNYNLDCRFCLAPGISHQPSMVSHHFLNYRPLEYFSCWLLRWSAGCWPLVTAWSSGRTERFWRLRSARSLGLHCLSRWWNCNCSWIGLSSWSSSSFDKCYCFHWVISLWMSLHRPSENLNLNKYFSTLSNCFVSKNWRFDCRVLSESSAHWAASDLAHWEEVTCRHRKSCFGFRAKVSIDFYRHKTDWAIDFASIGYSAAQTSTAGHDSTFEVGL